MVHFFVSSHEVVAFAEGPSRTPWPKILPSDVSGHSPGQEETVGVAGCDCSS